MHFWSENIIFASDNFINSNIDNFLFTSPESTMKKGLWQESDAPWFTNEVETLKVNGFRVDIAYSFELPVAWKNSTNVRPRANNNRPTPAVLSDAPLSRAAANFRGVSLVSPERA